MLDARSSGSRLPASSPDAYVAALGGWQRRHVEALRSAVTGAALAEGTPLERSTVVALVKAATALNAEFGDPTALS